VSSVQNSRAIEAALQRLQGPASAGKLLVHATGADTALDPGSCAIPIDAAALDRRGMVFVKPNPAQSEGQWTVTAAGTLVDVEAIGGGTPGNKAAGTVYRWDPPLDGIELTSASDASGVTGGSFSGAYAGLRQYVYLKSLNRSDVEALFAAQVYDYPAAALAWARTTPLDGPLAGSPGPRTARVGQNRMLYRHTWFLYLVTSRLDSEDARNLEADTLRDDVLELIQGARRTRNRAFAVSVEPGAEVQSADVFRVTPTSYVDLVTFNTIVSLEHNPEPRVYHDWLRTRLRQQTAAQAPAAPLDIPNVIIPIPPNGPGSPPFP
jgi:hypothetical protein